MSYKKLKCTTYILVLLLVLLIVILVKFYEQPFIKKYKINISPSDKTYEAGAYYFAKDINGNVLDKDVVEFVPNKLSYKFRDWKVTKEDNINMITFVCDINGYIEYNSNTTEPWYNSFMHHLPFIIDSKTGYMFNSNKISVDNTVNIISNEISDEKDRKYTEIKWYGKTFKIGVEIEDYFDMSNDSYSTSDKIPVSITATYKIETPANYDGIMIVIRKEGATEELYKKKISERDEITELRENEKETGVKSDRLKELEENINSIHKIIDPNDKTRENEKVDDYYFINLPASLNITNDKRLIKTLYVIVSIIILGSTLIIGLSINKIKTKKIKNRASKIIKHK